MSYSKNQESLIISSTGNLTLPGNPTSGNEPATKNYADSKVTQTITSGVTVTAPSENAVFAALGGKLSLTGGTLASGNATSRTLTVSQANNANTPTTRLQNLNGDVSGQLILELLFGASVSSLSLGAEFINFGRSGNGQIGSITVGASTSSVSFNTTSDLRLKTNIRETSACLDKILSCSVKDWEWKEGKEKDTGLIAQQVHSIFPNVVKVGDFEEEVQKAWSIDYGKLTPYLIKAVQELKQELDSVKAELAQLKE